MSPEVAKTIYEGGGWVALIFLVGVIAVTGIRKVWVFGWIYEKSEARSDRLEAALDKLTTAVEPVPVALKDVEQIPHALEDVKLALSRLEGAVDDVGWNALTPAQRRSVQQSRRARG